MQVCFSFFYIYLFSFLLLNLVMDISSIRKANLINLVDKYGSQKEFAEAVNTAAAYLSQIANGTIGKNGKPASMGGLV